MKSLKSFIHIAGCLIFLALCQVASAATLLDVTSTVGAGDPTQAGRLSRNGVLQDWSGGETFPGAVNGGVSYHYKSFTVPAATIGAARFIQISVDSTSTTVFAAAYDGTYAPNAAAPPNYGLDTNYLGDAGTSGNFFGTDALYFQVVVPVGHDLVVVVNDTGGGVPAGNSFRILAEGFTDTQFSEGAVGPHIASDPENQEVCEGQSASFTVQATGSGTLSYHWRRGTMALNDGNNLSGTTSPTLTINPAGIGDAAPNYNVVVTDSSGNTTSHDATLLVDPLPDVTITAANAVFSGSAGNTASVPDAGSGATYAWTIDNGAITSAADTRSIVYSADATGSVTLHVTVNGAASCTASNSLDVPCLGTDPQLVATRGDQVPGGEPVGTTYVSFGVPSFDGNRIGFLATIKPPTGSSMRVILGGDTLHVLLRKGDPAPGVSGATFSSFKDPVFGGGHLAVLATLTNNLGGVTSDGNSGIWSNALGSLQLVAREGSPAPGAPGGIFHSFSSLALPPGGAAVFVARLEQDPVGAPDSITKLNDLGLWREIPGGATSLLREGDLLTVDAGPARTVKTFTVLTSVSSSHGQRRGYASDSSLVLRVYFDDGTEAIVEAPGNGGPLVIAALTDGAPAQPATAAFKKFGVPAITDEAHAFFGELQARVGGVTSAGDTALFTGTPGNFSIAVREGDTATGATGTFARFKDPALAGANRLGFLGSTSDKDTGLWTNAFGFVQLIAIDGPLSTVPGVPGAQFSSFTSFALPESTIPRGPVFVGKLLTGSHGTAGPGGVDKTDLTGLWATSTTGTVKLIARTGDPVMVDGVLAHIRLITALGTVSGSPGQGRALNGAAQIIYRVTLDNHSQAIYTVQIP